MFDSNWLEVAVKLVFMGLLASGERGLGTGLEGCVEIHEEVEPMRDSMASMY